MHSDAYEPIWIKLEKMIDITELYSWVLVYMTLDLSQGHRDAR